MRPRTANVPIIIERIFLKTSGRRRLRRTCQHAAPRFAAKFDVREAREHRARAPRAPCAHLRDGGAEGSVTARRELSHAGTPLVVGSRAFAGIVVRSP